MPPPFLRAAGIAAERAVAISSDLDELVGMMVFERLGAIRVLSGDRS